MESNEISPEKLKNSKIFNVKEDSEEEEYEQETKKVQRAKGFGKSAKFNRSSRRQRD